MPLVNEVRDTTIHDRSARVIGRLRQLEGRLSRVTSNVCGMGPERGGAETEQPRPIDESLVDKFHAMDRWLSDIENEMVRLENSIGSNSAPQGQQTPKAPEY